MMCLCPPSSAVAEMCEVFPRILIVNLLNHSPFSKKRSIVCAENQGEVSYEKDASKSASEYQKKDDAAHTTANFTFIDGRKPVASGTDGTTENQAYSGNGNCGNGELPEQR